MSQGNPVPQKPSNDHPMRIRNRALFEPDHDDYEYYAGDYKHFEVDDGDVVLAKIARGDIAVM